jgi:hypothetical protein
MQKHGCYIEAEADERGRHRSVATRLRRGTMVPAPTALNKCEAVGVDKRGSPRDMALRRRIRRVDARRRWRSLGVRCGPRATHMTMTVAATRA